MIERVKIEKTAFDHVKLKKSIKAAIPSLVFTKKPPGELNFYIKNGLLCLELTKPLTNAQKAKIKSLSDKAPASVSKQPPKPKAWNSMTDKEKIEELGRITGRKQW